MAFHFALEVVLRLRRSQERAERLKLEAIISERERARARLREVMEGSLALHRQFQQRLGGGMAGSEVQMETERETNVNSVCNVLRARISEIEQRRVAQVQVFFRVRQSQELLENLRRDKWNDYRMEQGRREQQELDDMFLMQRGGKGEH